MVRSSPRPPCGVCSASAAHCRAAGRGAAAIAARRGARWPRQGPPRGQAYGWPEGSRVAADIG
eukprot:7188020-Lingulodinium_polyedra.AAC.1